MAETFPQFTQDKYTNAVYHYYLNSMATDEIYFAMNTIHGVTFTDDEINDIIDYLNSILL
jgi:hypothetical protein